MLLYLFILGIVVCLCWQRASKAVVRKKNERKVREFIEELHSQFPVPPDMTAPKDVFEHVTNLLACDESIDAFEKVQEVVLKKYVTAKLVNGTLPRDLAYAKGDRVTFGRESWHNIKSSMPYFSLGYAGGTIYFYPSFCIIKDTDKTYLSLWKNIKVSSTKGSPVRYKYLHERKDGSPDKRFKHNPSTPVYLYSALTIDFGYLKINLVFSEPSLAERLVRLLRKNIRELQAAAQASPAVPPAPQTQPSAPYTPTPAPTPQPPKPAVDLKPIEPVVNEQSEAVRQIIDTYGREIVVQRIFIGLLADYKVFVMKYKLRFVFITMHEEGLMNRILAAPHADSTYREIAVCLQAHDLPASDIREALAYLRHALA